MPEITDPQVVAFSNEEVRPMSNTLYLAYWEAKDFLAQYIAGGIGGKIQDAGAMELVADGSDVDGRTRITGQDMVNLVVAADAYVKYVEGGAVEPLDRTTIIGKPHVQDPVF